eukprot:scaffold75792_cov65-Phaeocystis_antarctica.AAC.3
MSTVRLIQNLLIYDVVSTRAIGAILNSCEITQARGWGQTASIYDHYRLETRETRLRVFNTPPRSRRYHRSPRPGPSRSRPPVATPPLAAPQQVPPQHSPRRSPRRPAPVGRSGQISTWAALHAARRARRRCRCLRCLAAPRDARRAAGRP